MRAPPHGDGWACGAATAEEKGDLAAAQRLAAEALALEPGHALGKALLARVVEAVEREASGGVAAARTGEGPEEDDSCPSSGGWPSSCDQQRLDSGDVGGGCRGEGPPPAVQC